jgi:uncharacterized protein YbbC (DUF1343 family)
MSSHTRHACFTAPLALLLAAACTPGLQERDADRTPAAQEQAPVTEAGVRTGLEVLLTDSVHLVRGRRVGLITNPTAVTRDGQHAIDLLWESPEVDLVALFGPEHSLRGGVEAGVKIADQRDERTGLPIYSLYGQVQRPTPAMLRGVEILLFDMKDIGARPYTYIWTMAMAMEAARAQGIPFVVLDRPNPITARMEGPHMDMAVREVTQVITGYYAVPLRHGMTTGEVALYVNREFGVGAQLHVVPAKGWHGGMWWDETGLPWVDPSPRIPSLESALVYSGLVLAEATNVSVGRGTPTPFSVIGAPWMDAAAVLARVRTYEMPGVALETTTFVPTGEGWVPFRDEQVRGIRFRVTDREAFQPVWMTLVLLTEIRRQHPDRFRITNEGFTQMIGSRWARQAFDRGEEPRVIWARWNEELAAWSAVRERYRLYPAPDR